MKNNQKPFLISEIGGNHEGDFKKALELTKLAIESKVDCIKFQIYDADSLVNKKISPERHAHFKKFELEVEQYIELAKICKKNKIIFSASVWNLNILNKINKHIDIYKIGSGDLTSYPIIKRIIEMKKPIIISTGLSDFNEVENVVNFIREIDSLYYDKNMLAVLQCTSMYPINKSDVNLNVMNQFTNKLNVTAGYSDHTIGLFAIQTAISLGAEIIEFHFTDLESRNNKSFRDHQVSLTKDEVIDLLNYIDEIIKVKGDGEKRLLSIEKENKHEISFRRGVYLKKGIKKGEKILEKDLVLLRPYAGTDPRNISDLINSRAMKDLIPLEPLFKGKHYE